MRQPSNLASRVIAESDLRAERLISVLRISLASLLFLGVSFVLSQSEASGLSARHFELFSLLAGAVCYFVLGLVNFYCATKDRFKPWMSWAFNLGEVILVSFQLYLDVANPATPSLLAFASPVLLVVALVICVQVLRFKLELHLFSMLVLLVLCALVLLHDPQIGTPLSAEASHELHLLYSPPPNIMRLIMLTAMAMLIATAIIRSKRLIQTVARETEIAENQKRFLPVEISDRMTDDDLNALRMGEDRDIAVLFVDMRGFTETSQKLGARKTAELLSLYRKTVTQVVTQHNGVIDKFIGDGALIIFGLHSDLSSACSDALAATRGLGTAFDALATPDDMPDIRLAMGLHAGPAVIGAIGDNQRLEFTAIGGTINIAARLEEVAKQQDRMLAVSDVTMNYAGTDSDGFTSIGPIDIRGTSSAVDVLVR